MSSDPRYHSKRQIEKAVSDFAARVTPSADDSKYDEEKQYADLFGSKVSVSVLEQLRRKVSRPQNKVTPEETLTAIYVQNAKQDLREKAESHDFRKKFLIRLFWLICIWLGIVIVFVYKSARCPTVDDRAKLIEIQNKIVSMALDQTNRIDDSMIKIVSPKFGDSYFHLSDSVLITFITSTTAAVLGLFLTAANWLFKNGKRVNSSESS